MTLTLREFLRSKHALHSAVESNVLDDLLIADLQAYGEEWSPAERRRTTVYVVCLILIWIALLYFDEVVLLKPDFIFWSKVLIQNFFMALVFLACGYSVIFCRLNEGYSRKICHVFAYMLPILLHVLWSARKYDTDSRFPSSVELTWTCWVQFFPFLALVKPIRRKSRFLMVIFRAIDRQKDRPYTLTWMTSQLVGNYVAILIVHSYLASQEDYRRANLAILPMLVNVFGDGLAEPVGIRWGKNKYTTCAVWHNGMFCAGKFERSYEGSACVYFVTLIALVPFYSIFTVSQFTLSVIFLPLTTTLCEAWAPHTWDNPFLTMVCGVFFMLIFETIP